MMLNTNVEQFKKDFFEREKRVADAVSLRKPDRVPIVVLFGSFICDYAGITRRDYLYNAEAAYEANYKTVIELQPDLAPHVRTFGSILEILDFKQLKWAGRDFSDDIDFQFVEGEYMKADEYDAFLYDPTDFMLRYYWPRIFGKLKFFGDIPPLREIITYYLGAASGFIPFGLPEGHELLDILRKVGEESIKVSHIMGAHIKRLMSSGFPPFAGATTQAPFDTLGDFFRGLKGIMLDMYRRPEKVIAACEKLLPWMLEMAIRGVQKSGIKRVFIPLHKGQDGFMSLEQYKRFYWPTFKELLEALVREGITPIVLLEGKYDSRLEIIKDVPEGKIVYWFEHVDMRKAKKILGDRVCIMGNVPLALLVAGTPNDVSEYCKKLILEVGKDGGFIMSASGVLDRARVENVKAMFETTKNTRLI